MTNKLTIDDIGYLKEIRQSLELDENDSSEDCNILAMEPFHRVSLICGWYLWYDTWASEFKKYCESQGIYLTTNHDADGVF